MLLAEFDPDLAGEVGSLPEFQTMGRSRAPLQAVGTSTSCQRTTPFRGRGRLRKPLLHPQQVPLPIHQHLRRRCRLAGDCLEDTTRRDDRWIQT